MNRYRKNGNAIAFLFVTTMVAGIVNAYLVNPVLAGPLDGAYQQRTLLTTGALVGLYMSLGVIGIAIAFFPVLARYSGSIALSYLSFRIVEGLLLIQGALVPLFVVQLSQDYASLPAADSAYLVALSQQLVQVKSVTYQVAMAVLGIGSLMLCALMLRTGIVPRWVSTWGLVGYACLLASAVLALFGLIDTARGAGALLYIPGGVFELLVLPLWLLIRAFDTSQQTQ